MPRSYNEHVFSTDVFNKPLVLKDRDAISTLIVRLFLMEPGDNPNRPEMGIGLRSAFRYMKINNENLKKLMERSNDQIVRFLPYFQAVDVVITTGKDKMLSIDIKADDTLYKFETEMENNEISLKNILGY